MGLDGDAPGGKRDSGFCDDLLDFRQKLLAFLSGMSDSPVVCAGFATLLRALSALSRRPAMTSRVRDIDRPVAKGCQPYTLTPSANRCRMWGRANTRKDHPRGFAAHRHAAFYHRNYIDLHGAKRSDRVESDFLRFKAQSCRSTRRANGPSWSKTASRDGRDTWRFRKGQSHPFTAA